MTDVPRVKMGELFKAGPFYPTPWSVDDCEPEPEPGPEPEPEPSQPGKRLRKPSQKVKENRAASAANRYGWSYGAFQSHSGDVKEDGTLTQGWLRIPLEEDQEEKAARKAPVKEFDNSAFLADMASYNETFLAECYKAQGSKLHTIDVGEYYTMPAEDRVIRILGMLMTADDL